MGKLKIPASVVLFHALLVATLLYFQAPAKKISQRRPIVVRTKLEAPCKPTSIPKETPITISAVPAAPPSTPKPVVQETKKIPTTKPVVKKIEAPSPPPQDKLIALMQESLNNLGKAPSVEKSTAVSKSIGKLASETLSFEADYEEELILYLETQIFLPEQGDVKLKLTLTKTGGVSKIDIIACPSERNKKYVESALAACVFPTFGKHFKGQSTHTFSITLKSS